MPLIRILHALLLSMALAGCAMSGNNTLPANTSRPAFDGPTPYTVERFNLPGPVAGVAVKIDLTDPRVSVQVALADDRDPDGDGPCVGMLDTTSSAAKRLDFDITMNASFFAAPTAKEAAGKKIRYFVGNCTYPEGWHFSAGKLISKPAKNAMRSTIVVHDTGKISIEDDLRELPADTRFAVSGNATVLKNGMAIAAASPPVRHPRSSVGISADGRTLLMVAVDGRQSTVEESPYKRVHSRGMTMNELGELMRSLGANDAINLDGGGSTSLVLKDPHTGVFTIANQPSDFSTLGIPVAIERPVADVIGIRVERFGVAGQR